MFFETACHVYSYYMCNFKYGMSEMYVQDVWPIVPVWALHMYLHSIHVIIEATEYVYHNSPIVGSR